MRKIILFVFLWSNMSIALGQRTSVKTHPTGSGPVLSGVSIVHTHIGLDPTKVRFEKRMPTYNVVNLKFSLNGNVSLYRYKGQTYQTYYPSSGNLNDCPGAMLDNAKGPNMGLSVKVTIVIRVKGKTYTQTTTTIATAGVYHFRFTLDEYVQEQFVDAKNIVSITVEPVPISYFENQIDRMEQCKERKEKEKKAKEREAAEAEEQQSAPKDDDFWAGGEEKKLTLGDSDTKVTTKKASNDFWSGGDIKATNDVSASQTTSEVKYRIRREDGYSWVESESGDILIPKTSYNISSYRDGLAYVTIRVGTDYDDELGRITLSESFYLDSKGQKLPPIRKTINFPPRAVLFTYNYGDTAEDKERAVKDYHRRRDRAEERVMAKYRALGYDY